MDTIRQKIFDAVVAQLKTIATANTYEFYGFTGNYNSDIGSRVFAWRSSQITQPSEFPLIVIRDVDELVDEPSAESRRVVKRLRFIVEILASGPTAADDLRNKYYPDVELAIGVGAVNRWGLMTGATRPKLTRSLVETESGILAGGVVEFSIDYVQIAWYPYGNS